MSPAGPLRWDRDGADWPNRQASAFVSASGLQWHVQRFGVGPVALLVHGTGASSHSWRDVAPLLARRLTVIAVDLPGHAFTSLPASERLSLPGMAHALGGLLHELAVAPAIAVGHSAGAAVLTRMCLDGSIAPRRILAINGALLPLPGLPGRFFSPTAKLLARAPGVARLIAYRAGNPRVVRRLITDMGSALDEQGLAWYRRLGTSPEHVGAAVQMMARWDLHALAAELPRLQPPLTLIIGDRDRAIPPREALRVMRLVANADCGYLPGAGHLAHEEQPEQTARLIVRAAVRAGILDDD
jgi:magnesium chelatase accessory protein